MRARTGYLGLAALDTLMSGAATPWIHRARILTKPLLMPLLGAALAGSASPVRRPVLVAQACGWVGDVALLSEDRRPFLVGTTAFGLGHAAYVVGFGKLSSGEPLASSRPARRLLTLWALTAPGLALAAARRDRTLGLPVAAYATSLTAMAVSAHRLSPSVSADARRLASLGALLFLASDSTLGLRKFVLSDPPGYVEAAVMATYTAAQLLLAEAALRA